MARGKKSDKDSGHSFEDYFKRAASPMLVLHLLDEQPMYVYQMTQELERRSFGVYTLPALSCHLPLGRPGLSGGGRKTDFTG